MASKILTMLETRPIALLMTFNCCMSRASCSGVPLGACIDFPRSCHSLLWSEARVPNFDNTSLFSDESVSTRCFLTVLTMWMPRTTDRMRNTSPTKEPIMIATSRPASRSGVHMLLTTAGNADNNIIYAVITRHTSK